MLLFYPHEGLARLLHHIMQHGCFTILSHQAIWLILGFYPIEWLGSLFLDVPLRDLVRSLSVYYRGL